MVEVRCPLTRQPLREPVVHQRGVSVELDAFNEQFVNLVAYPNRSLKEYINLDDNANFEVKRSIFCCPITCALLRDPVIDPVGNTFERRDIEDWIEREGVSPYRIPLRKDQLYDNTTLLIVLIQEIQQLDEFLQEEQEIMDWKREVSRVAEADPPLTLEELLQALQSPPVPDPPLDVLRDALQPIPPPAVPDPSLATLRTVLGRDIDLEAPLPTTRIITEPLPLLLQELEQVQQDEEERRQNNEDADLNLNLLCQTYRLRFAFLALLLLALVVGAFLFLQMVVDAKTVVFFLIPIAIFCLCFVGTGDCCTNWVLT